MVAMVDLFVVIMTCTPHPRILYTIYYGTLEYCTVCGTNSLVAGPGSGMVQYTCYCSVQLLIAHTRLLSDLEFYVSSYYFGCS